MGILLQDAYMLQTLKRPVSLESNSLLSTLWILSHTLTWKGSENNMALLFQTSYTPKRAILQYLSNPFCVNMFQSFKSLPLWDICHWWIPKESLLRWFFFIYIMDTAIAFPLTCFTLPYFYRHYYYYHSMVVWSYHTTTTYYHTTSTIIKRFLCLPVDGIPW